MDQILIIEEPFNCNKVSAGFDDLPSSCTNIKRPANYYLKSVFAAKTAAVRKYPSGDLRCSNSEKILRFKLGFERVNRCEQIVEVAIEMWAKITAA